MVLDEKDIEVKFLEIEIDDMDSLFDADEEVGSAEPLLRLYQNFDISLSAEEIEKLKLRNNLSQSEFKEWVRMRPYQKQKILRKIVKTKDFKELAKSLADYVNRREAVLKDLKDEIKNQDSEKLMPNAPEEILYSTMQPVSCEKIAEKQKNASEKVLEKGSVLPRNSGQIAKASGKQMMQEALKAPVKVTKVSAEASKELVSKATLAVPTDPATKAIQVGVKAVKKAAKIIKKAYNMDEQKSTTKAEDVKVNLSNPKQTDKDAKFITRIITVIQLAVAPLLSTILPFIVIVSVVFSVIASLVSVIGAVEDRDQAPLNIALSSEVMAYKPMVELYAQQFGISEYVPYLLAIMQVESGGKGSDVMQSSESQGYPPGTLIPEASIEQACRVFSGLLAKSMANGSDISAVVQAYNYGSGFLDFIVSQAKWENVWSYEAAEEFARIHSGGTIAQYRNAVSIPKNGGWRYAYGNQFYVLLVNQYVLCAAISDETIQSLLSYAFSFQGCPYKLGGKDPKTGIDCSAFTQMCYAYIGVSIPGTAQTQYDACQKFSDEAQAKPGDLIFFTKTSKHTNNPVTHVEIYVGNGKCFGAGDPVGYHNIHDKYHKEHFYSFGRVLP